MNSINQSRQSSVTFSRIIKISRFPFFWIWSTGFLFWGGLAANRGFSFGEPSFILLVLWFMLPANIFLNAINDAFDYDTDVNNLRKHGLESVAEKGEMRNMLIIAAVSLVSVFLIFPFVSGLVRSLIMIWACIVIAYNVPPLRLKKYPVTDILFGGVGHFVPIAIIGYVDSIGRLPGVELIILAILYTAGWHCFGSALDVPYDISAGIKNSTARLGSERKGLLLSLLFFIASICWAFAMGFYLAIFLIAPYPFIILINIYRGNIRKRSVEIFKELIYATYIFGFLIGIILTYIFAYEK